MNWTLSGNYNETKITRLSAAPAALGGIPLFDLGAQSNLETASPKAKVIASAFYSVGKFSATIRGTVYGKSSNYTSPDGGFTVTTLVNGTPTTTVCCKQTIGTAFIGDLELNYDISKDLEFSIGANNIFNKRPPTLGLVPGTTTNTLVGGGNQLDAPLTFSPYGINGGYYYARMNVSF